MTYDDLPNIEIDKFIEISFLFTLRSWVSDQLVPVTKIEEQSMKTGDTWAPKHRFFETKKFPTRPGWVIPTSKF